MTFLEKSDAFPILIPNTLSDVKSFLQEMEIDGFILSGGDNIGDDPERDQTEREIIDFAIDNNTRFSFQEYIKKIVSLLNDNGILLFESQALDAMVPGAFEAKRRILDYFFKILEERMVESEYPLNVPKRIFLVLQKTVKHS